MNRIQEYFWFLLPYRRFNQLSYHLRTLEPQLNDLNEKRKRLQREYVALRNVTSKCRECQGACCKGSETYFSVIDYLIRMFSDNPISECFRFWRPHSISAILLGRIRSFWIHSNHANTVTKSICSNLTPSGCALQAEDRPIRCILWICDDLKKAIPLHELRKLGGITRELSAISADVTKCFRNPISSGSH